MDETRIAELRKFVAIITDPKISGFIDLRKLCHSGIYNLAVQMAADHAIKHGDFGYLNNILALLEKTTHASDLISSLRPKLNFVITDTKPRKLTKATAEQGAKTAKQTPGKPIAIKTAPLKPTKKGPIFSRDSQDIMDSRLMLQGSYGNGKRR